ncbi:hypothetical protein [Polymorphospora rubra]|uniref:hypothetical protein n=1 Tax=Polymorphospora rubra TaxID=338584 RepID=UPI0033F5596E
MDDIDTADTAALPPPIAADPAAGPDEPPTATIWTGSAAVPPATPKRRRWSGLDLPGNRSQPEPPRDPTLELPIVEREALHRGAPVDPWAESDPWSGHPPANPPTRPFPAVPEQPPAAPPPQPAARPPKPPRASRRDRRPRQPGGPPAVVPPGWRPPPGYVAVPVRRRRRWPLVMALLTLFTIACCCGCPAYFGKPMWEQYPAAAALPVELAGMTLRDDPDSVEAARQLEQGLGIAALITGDTFAGIYSAANGKRVTLFGSTGYRFSPENDLNEEIARLTTEYRLTGVESVETGIRGTYQRCGTGRQGDTAIVLCAWADHGSLGTGLFTRLSVEDSSRLLDEMRTVVITRG